MSRIFTESGSGIAPNVAAGLSYLLVFVSGLILYFVEKEDEFVRFHAIQSILFSITVAVLDTILFVMSKMTGLFPEVVSIISGLVVLIATLALYFGSFALWLFLLTRAFQGKRYHLFVIGEIAERYARKS